VGAGLWLLAITYSSIKIVVSNTPMSVYDQRVIKQYYGQYIIKMNYDQNIIFLNALKSELLVVSIDQNSALVVFAIYDANTGGSAPAAQTL